MIKLLHFPRFHAVITIRKRIVPAKISKRNIFSAPVITKKKILAILVVSVRAS